MDVPKNDDLASVGTPSPSEVENAMLAKQGLPDLAIRCRTRAGAEVMTDLAAREAHRWLGDEDAPRSLEEAIANLQDITSCILETQRALGDSQHRLEQQLAAVADDIEERWQAIEQQLAAVLTRPYRYD